MQKTSIIVAMFPLNNTDISISEVYANKIKYILENLHL